MKEAIILAGGLGTRLSHVVSDVQKVMAPVGGRPFLTYIFDELLRFGFDTFVLAVSYREDSVRSFFGSSYRGAAVIYSEEKEPLGTGGAIKQALTFCENDDVPVINGDTFFAADLNELTTRHKEKHADITVTVKKMSDFSRYGSVSFDESGRITGFGEKRYTRRGHINGGIYCVNRRALDGKDGRFSFEKDILEQLAVPVFAFISDGYFIDIGIPEDYFRAQTEIPLLTGRKTFRAVFLDRDGTLNVEKNHVYDKNDFEFIPGAPDAIAKLREHGYLIIVVTNQAGVAKGLYTEQDVNILHEYILSLLKDKTYIDAFYYCPYHKDAAIEKYRGDSPDRKPGAGMIQKAVRDFADRGITIDLSSSVIVGDTANDILTGINAGIGRKVFVLSGHGERKDGLLADVTVKDLAAAAEYILSEDKNEIHDRQPL